MRMQFRICAKSIWAIAEMKAVLLYDKQDLRCENIAMAPDPTPDEVRVRVAYAGICGSDIHNFKTGQWIRRKPSIAGHEFSGFIEAVGSNVSGLEVGDKIAADSRYYCSDCANCRSGKVHLCENLGFVGEAIDGGFADFITIPAKLCLKCKPEAALDIAALAEPLAVALHALSLLNIPDDEPLLIIGCGPIGALCAVASVCKSDRPLFVCDVNGVRAERCAELSGANVADLADFSQSDSSAAKPVRFVLDTTGNVGVIDSLLQKMSGCTIGLVGIGSGELTIDPVHLVEREISIVGCHAFADELPEAIALLHESADRFEGIIGERITLEQTVAAYGVISSGKSQAIKTLIEVSGE